MVITKKRGIPTAQQPRVVIGLAPNHHAIGMLQVLRNLGVGLDASVDRNEQVREIFFELVRQLVTQRRNFAVFFRAQAIQPSVARMHDEHLTTRLAHGAHKIAHKVVALDAVNPNAVLHGDRNVHHIAHGLDAIGHGLGLVHQASPKSAPLNAV